MLNEMIMIDLLTPRVKVDERGYPNMHPLKGGMILTYNDRDYSIPVWENLQNKSVYVYPKSIEPYPHIFQPIPWYADRAAEDMPKWVKYSYNKTTVVYPFDDIFYFTDAGFEQVGDHAEWLPATEAEYNDYLN